MSTASRTIQYFSAEQLESVELRIVADDQVAANENELLALVAVERQVVTRLAHTLQWPHRTVTLFMLADLTSLQNQLQALDQQPVGAQLDQMGDLLTHPVVNVYDLADPSACHIFINRQAMIKAGYWNDMLALRGLLAHEHAHPLAECAATRAVRQLQLKLDLRLTQPWSPHGQTANADAAPQWADHAQSQLNSLVRTLILLGPREVFTNEIALATGFVQPLLHLNRQNVKNLVVNLAHRPTLQRQLTEAVRASHLSAVGAAALALIGDLQGHLMMAMEVAAFQRQGEQAASEELLTQLEKDVFSQLDATVGPLFQKICAAYVRLPTTASPGQMLKFAQEQLTLLTRALSQRSLRLTYQVTIRDDLVQGNRETGKQVDTSALLIYLPVYLFPCLPISLFPCIYLFTIMTITSHKTLCLLTTTLPKFYVSLKHRPKMPAVGSLAWIRLIWNGLALRLAM